MPDHFGVAPIRPAPIPPRPPAPRPVLPADAGGVMGKMIDAQSFIVASTVTKWYGHEGDILR